MANENLPPLDLEQLAQSLSKGFEALLEEVKDLAQRETILRKNLEVAKKEVSTPFLLLANIFHDENPKLALDRKSWLPGSCVRERALHVLPDCILLTRVANMIPAIDLILTIFRNLQHGQISPVGSSEQSINLPNGKGEPEAEVYGDGLPLDHTDSFMASEAIREAMDACRAIKTRPAKKADTITRSVGRNTGGHEDLEHDFTTPGVQGNLQCPFARMAENGRQTTLTNGAADPIAAEFHPDQASVPSNHPSAQGPGKCPIRFLDQHSPEEVAQYFENHKHEIPRSHEICVKRYQQNEQSIRQLDAKYGSLVNMIQGLGVKHKRYLPEDEKSQKRPKAQGSVEAVEKWADGISDKILESMPEQIPPENGIPEDEEERKPHFAGSLREVRVGESPSRPWGISVPPAQEPSKSAMLSDKGSEHIPLARSDISISKPVQEEQVRKCPVDHGINDAIPDDRGAQKARKTPATKALGQETSSHPHIVFNGPVFFGYSAEQAAALLQSAHLANGPH